MKYFFLTADKGNALPHITNLHQQIDVRHLNKQDAHRLSRFITLQVHPNPGLETFYADVLTHPLFIVTKGIAEVMSLYDASIDYKVAALFDLEARIGKTYFVPILDQIDCLAEGTELNLDRRVIRRAVIDPDRTLGKAIFKLAGVKNTYIVVRLDFVESILRRQAAGISLEEICLK